MKVVNMGQPNDLLLDDLEQLLREIDEFNSASGSNKPLDIPQSLDNYLQFVARSGNTVFPWPCVRNLFRTKMMNAIQQFQEPASPNESFVLERFDLFRMAAPFTVQRLTELILQPTRHYRKKEKFLRGLEKTVLVVSTVEPQSLNNDVEKNGNEANNVSVSSMEEDTENVFNRTFPVERQEIISSVRSLGIDPSESIVLDPVTTSAVSAAVDVINQNIGVTTEAIISEGVGLTNTSVPPIDVIAPDITIAVSSESIILDTVPDASTSTIVNIEGNDSVECQPSSIVAEVSASSLLQCVSEQDLVSTAMQQAAAESLPPESVLEGVTSSLINMDAVKLPLTDNITAEVDCAQSADTGAEDQAVNIFQCVSAGPHESELVQPIQASDIISADPLSEAVSVVTGIVDASPAGLISSDKPSDEFGQVSSVEENVISSECETSIDQSSSSIVPQQTDAVDPLQPSISAEASLTPAMEESVPEAAPEPVSTELPPSSENNAPSEEVLASTVDVSETGPVLPPEESNTETLASTEEVTGHVSGESSQDAAETNKTIDDDSNNKDDKAENNV